MGYTVAAVELPKTLLEKLREVARGRDIPLETLIVQLLSQPLDPKHRIEVYKHLFQRYLEEAKKLYEKGDLLQAGEKLWGAVTTLLNIIGELEDKPHYRHSDYWDIIEDVVRETRDPEYSTLFALAERLHANYYHGFMAEESFQACWESVMKLVEKLRRHLKKKHGLEL